MSAIMNATPWKVPIGRPNCSRSFAYGTAASSAAWARPRASARDRDPAAVEHLEERPEAGALLAQQVGGRDADAVEPQLAGRRGVEAHLVLEPPDAEARRVGRDDERGDRRRAVGVRARSAR